MKHNINFTNMAEAKALKHLKEEGIFDYVGHYYDSKIYMHPQMFGSTSTMFNGVGGCAMTTAYVITIIIDTEYDKYVLVYCSDQLAYVLKNPNHKFYNDLKNQRLVSQHMFEEYIN